MSNHRFYIKARPIPALLFITTALLCSCGGHKSWPPDTEGPNLPVRYCDIYEGVNDETVIGYAFVDTAAVSWRIPPIFKGYTLTSPTLSDLRKAEQVLQKAYPSILEDAYDKEGYLFKKGGLRNYARQYVFLQDSNENMYLFVQFLILSRADLEDKAFPVYDPSDTLPPPPPSVRLNLSRELIMIEDGGDAHWSATLDLGKEEIIWVMVN